MSLGFKRLIFIIGYPDIVNGYATNKISLHSIHCIVSSEAQFETWRWPSERAETCSLSNKYYTTLLVVFDCTTLYHLIVSNTIGMSQLKTSNMRFNLNSLFSFCYNHVSKKIVPVVRVVIHGGLSECEFLCILEVRNKIHFQNIMLLLWKLDSYT